MAVAFIGFGSNLGNGLLNLYNAWQKLGNSLKIDLLQLSSPYRTEPVAVNSTNWFTNAVGKIQTTIPPRELLQIMLQVETELGRDRTKGPDRQIDLDLLFYDDLILEAVGLTLPHPEITNRLFVLTPFAEVAPDFVHPLLHKSMDRLAAELAPTLKAGQSIKKMNWPG